jgi:hypothetical protein
MEIGTMFKAKVKLKYCATFDGLQDVIFKVGDVFEFTEISDSMFKVGYTLMTPNVLPEEISDFTFSKEIFDKHFEKCD